jgi:hypothetical protein
MRHQIDDGRKAGLQIPLSVDKGHEFSILKWLVQACRTWTVGTDARSAWRGQRVAIHDVKMGIDEAWNNCGSAEVDHLCAGWNLGGWADVNDPIPSDDDDLVGQQPACC